MARQFVVRAEYGSVNIRGQIYTKGDRYSDDTLAKFPEFFTEYVPEHPVNTSPEDMSVAAPEEVVEVAVVDAAAGLLDTEPAGTPEPVETVSASISDKKSKKSKK
jgi:hypothetical protein